MARPVVRAVTVRRRSPRRVAGDTVTPWRDVPRVVRLTAVILRAHEATGASQVDGVVAIGRQIATIKAALAHGEFLAWAREAVPFGPRTVQRYLSLAGFADRDPDELRRLAHLGPTKLYRIAALAPEPRRQLKLRTPIPIPDGDEKTVEVMTIGELDRVIGGFATPPMPRTPVDKIVQGCRFRLAGLRTLTDELRARSRDVDPMLASDLVAELHGLAEALEATFGLSRA